MTTDYISDYNLVSPLVLLVHAPNAYFQWCQIQLEYFKKYSKLQGIPINILYHWQDVLCQNSRFIVVIGVDQGWIDDVLFHLSPYHLHITLIDGIIYKGRDNYSHVYYDQGITIQYSIELLRKHSRYQTALFGVQDMDTSDESKAIAFSHYASPNDIYYIKDGIEYCFRRFLSHIDHYDSVICTNDIVAVYFLSRCREFGISIPEQLYLIGNCNLWISSHVTPKLTTVNYRSDAIIKIVLQLYRNFQEFSNLNTMSASLKPILIERESTEYKNSVVNANTINLNQYKYSDILFPITKHAIDPEIQKIRTLDMFLSSCSSETLNIIQCLTDDLPYQTISDKMFLSIDTTKYHIKKIYRHLNIHSRQELQMLMDKYSLRIT